MIVVYIAGPFRAADSWQRERNIREAEERAFEVWSLGVVAICPHTNTRFFDGALPDHVWLDGDLEILKRCDALLTTRRWKESTGAKQEVDFAREHQIPVFHDITQLEHWIGTVVASSR